MFSGFSRCLDWPIISDEICIRVTGNRGGDDAVRRRWDRQLSDVGQFRFVPDAAACSSARERARIVQATLRVVAPEVIRSTRNHP